ncbi:MAG TPA: hypothetical protein VOA00_04910 [Thermoanaerobaculia bacterium]|nr:hypothetical protein [Thermoanaerobaculia bacterium]
MKCAADAARVRRNRTFRQPLLPAATSPPLRPLPAARPGRGAAFLLLAFAAAVAAGCATRPPGIQVRDSFPLDPREELSGPFPESVDRGWEALLRGDARAAAREFASARSEGHRLAADIGWIEAEVLLGDFERALAACQDTLASGEATLPLLVVCGEARGRGGRPSEGYRLYQRAVARTAGRPGLKARAEELRIAARDALAAQARVASEERKFAEARDRIAAAIDIAPESAGLREFAAEIEFSAGQPDKALRRYREAYELEPTNVSLAERVGNLAEELDEHAFAVAVFDALARSDPKFKRRAEEARLAFRVANWPPPEREAARAERLTRASASNLVWWMFPEVREAHVRSGVIASDAVSRRDTRAFARALALGLLEADRETHRGNPDATLTRGAASRLLLRLLSIVNPKAEPACLGKGDGRAGRSTAEAIRSAEACGLWKEEAESSPPSGPEFTRALDRIRALASGGGNSSRE